MMNIFFLIVLISNLQYPIFSSRPTPRETLGIGGGGRKIIPIELQTIPRAAFAQVAVGDPPVLVHLHVDTGMPLTWVLPKPGSLYDPSASASFADRNCDGLGPEFWIPGGAGDNGCKYEVPLSDETWYVGKLGLETLTYRTGYWGYSTMENIILGVGRTDGGPQVGMGSLGLSVGTVSIIKPFGEKFSICIGSFNNEFNKGKQFLALGDDAILIGKKVPFIITETGDYKISLTSVTINGEKQFGLQNVLSSTGAILDTGTSTISLVPQVYRLVFDKINQKLIDAGEGGLSPYRQNPDHQSHNGTIPKHLDIGLGLGFGDVTIHLPITKLFHQVFHDVYFLVVDESPLEVNIIGIPAFQGHNIAVDALNRKMHVKEIDCNVLYDGYKDELSQPNP